MRHQSLRSWSEIWKNIRYGARVARHVGRVPHLHEHKVSARTFTLLCSQCSLTPFRTVILSPTLKILSSFNLMESQTCLKGDEYATVEIRSRLNHHIMILWFIIIIIIIKLTPSVPPPNPRVILPPPHICIPPSQPVTHLNTKLMNAPPAPHITNPDYATPLIIQPTLISIIDRCDHRQITVMSQIICHLGIIQFCSIPILSSKNSYISTYMPKMTKK